MFYPVLLHRQGALEDEVAEPGTRGAGEFHPTGVICVTRARICNLELSFLLPGLTKERRADDLYLQVSLYISSGVCGKGSVFFLEPGLERGLTALQSKAAGGNVFQPFSTQTHGGAEQ